MVDRPPSSASWGLRVSIVCFDVPDRDQWPPTPTHALVRERGRWPQRDKFLLTSVSRAAGRLASRKAFPGTSPADAVSARAERLADRRAPLCSGAHPCAGRAGVGARAIEERARRSLDRRAFTRFDARAIEPVEQAGHPVPHAFLSLSPPGSIQSPTTPRCFRVSPAERRRYLSTGVSACQEQTHRRLSPRVVCGCQ